MQQWVDHRPARSVTQLHNVSPPCLLVLGRHRARQGDGCHLSLYNCFVSPFWALQLKLSGFSPVCVYPVMQVGCRTLYQRPPPPTPCQCTCDPGLFIVSTSIQLYPPNICVADVFESVCFCMCVCVVWMSAFATFECILASVCAREVALSKTLECLGSPEGSPAC